MQCRKKRMEQLQSLNIQEIRARVNEKDEKESFMCDSVTRKSADSDFDAWK